MKLEKKKKRNESIIMIQLFSIVLSVNKEQRRFPDVAPVRLPGPGVWVKVGV